MQTAIIFIILYVILLPIIFRLIAVAQKKLIVDRKIMKAGKDRNALKNIPKPIWPIWKERIFFTLKDKRILQKKAKKDQESKEPKTSGLSRQKLFFILYLAGLVIAAISGFVYPLLFLLSVVLFFSAIIFAINSSKKLLEMRAGIYQKMYEIARSKLNQSAEYAENPQAIIRIKDWADYIKPQKVEFDVPTTFSDSGEEEFLRQFNQVFGREQTWVADNDPEAGIIGWDYENGKVTIRAVPPLPRMAPWDEHYVLSDDIAWSFFPIGLGVENGVELTNPKTGEVENVLGFDLSGEQAKLGAKRGIQVASKIVTSPMVLVGGGTGGGKSLSSDTLVRVFEDEDLKNI
jgi:hypothetical protein